MSDPVLVDTHLHLASPDRTRYPLSRGLGVNPWHEKTAAPVEELLAAMDRRGVAAAVLVQGHGPYAFDNSYCADARLAAPDRLVSASIIDMTRADRVERLAFWATERGMGGTRVLHLPPPDPPWLDDRAVMGPVLERANELGLRVSVCLVRRHLGALANLLAWAPPSMPVALDHSGLVDLPGHSVDAGAFDELCTLARFANLHLKVSPHVLAYAAVTGRTPAELMRDLAAAFGAHRLMWGTDWPNAGRDYAALIEQGVRAAALLAEADAARFLGGTALALWPELAT